MVRNLLLQNGGQANLRHPRPPQHALPLHQGGRRNDEHIITPTLAAGLEQKRYVENRKRLPPGTNAVEKTFFLGSHHRVKDRLEPRQGCGIVKHPFAEWRPIDPAGLGLDTRERSSHGWYGSA